MQGLFFAAKLFSFFVRSRYFIISSSTCLVAAVAASITTVAIRLSLSLSYEYMMIQLGRCV